MSTSYKAQAIAHELAAKLKERSYTTVVESFDANDSALNPLIQFGSGTAGQANFVIKVQPTSWPLAQDILGLAANNYTPHVVMILTEAGAGGVVDPAAMTPQIILDLLAQSQLMGCRVEWYETPNATAPTAANFFAQAVAANLKATFHPDVRYPLISSQ